MASDAAQHFERKQSASLLYSNSSRTPENTHVKRNNPSLSQPTNYLMVSAGLLVSSAVLLIPK